MRQAKKHLNISLLVTSELVAIFGQLYVDTPDGYFGGANQFTAIGITYAFVSLLLASIATYGIAKGRRWGHSLAVVNVLGLMFAFAPSLFFDPIHAGVVIAWLLWAVGRMLYIEVPKASLALPRPDDSTYQAHRNAALIAIFLTLAIIGFYLTDHFFGVALCAAAHILAIGFFVPTWRGQKSNSRRLFYLQACILTVAVLFLPLPKISMSIATVFHIISLYGSIRARPLLPGFFAYFLRLPALFLVTSFVVIILLGAMFLSFPAATTAGSISAIDVLFTAVSAVCVTGLIVLDTPVDFTTFGQVVILVLIQLGGLGIMTLSTIGARLIAGNLGLLAESTFGNLLDVRGARSTYKLIRVILLTTVVIETMGAAVLAICFQATGLDWGTALWKGIFHSISAFCNAGFALQSDSLESLALNNVALFTIMGLIVMGGLGFPTVVMLIDYWRSPRKTRVPVQVRIILWASGILILIGWVGFTALEWQGALQAFDPANKIINGLFQSITLRTAGFNSVPLADLSKATLAFMIVFMFIGGAPGGTAGGIKVTTLAILLAAVPSFGHGEGTVTIGGRRIPASAIFRAISIVVVTLATVLILHFLLLMLQPESFEALAFEAVSAVGTVGLSVGVTSSLTTTSKALVILGMFAGRIGPLTLALAIAGRQRKRYTLAAEPVMVG